MRSLFFFFFISPTAEAELDLFGLNNVALLILIDDAFKIATLRRTRTPMTSKQTRD